jgi:uncharacterized protein (DUF1684 family)
MVKNIIFYTLIGLTIFTVFFYFSETSSSEYSESINKQHQEQQRHLAAGDSLTITKKLNYFTVNEKYITTAKVNIFDSANTLSIKFFKNKDTVQYIRIAALHFIINQQEHQLTLFRNNKTNDFILPFTDSTNTVNTHQTGRYLPIKFNHQEYIDLDFNMAYNPYCAYDTNYTCAVTPEENHLATAIKAGQLRY